MALPRGLAHAVTWALLIAVLAAEPRPLPAGAPVALIASSTRVHVFADEELDADHLRLLARPGVVLWLSTRSNTLKASTIDSLALFQESWVELRSPLNPVSLNQLTRLPRTGVVLGAGSLKDARVLGPRRLAVRWSQPIDEASAASLVAARPSWLFWSPPEPVDALAWGLFKKVPGRKLFSPPPGSPSAPCEQAEVAGEPALLAHAATLMGGQGPAFPCGRGPWVELSSDVEPWIVQSVVLASPSAELKIVIGADQKASVRTRQLLDAIGFQKARK